MKYGFEIVTKPTVDGKVVQELHSTNLDHLIRCVIDTQEQQIREALIALGWTPPSEKPR
jgi:hypothetical protein